MNRNSIAYWPGPDVPTNIDGSPFERDELGKKYCQILQRAKLGRCLEQLPGGQTVWEAQLGGIKEETVNILAKFVDTSLSDINIDIDIEKGTNSDITTL